MSGARVGIVFDNSVRPETTGIYCRRALSELVRAGILDVAEHFLPGEWHRLKEINYDWVLIVDDGLDYDIPVSSGPYAWWAIDTHLNFDRCLRRARMARWTFAAQKDGAERLRAAGINAFWLPLGCDPDLHGHQPAPKRFDISFVGNLIPGERTDLIQLIQQRFPNTFVGQRFFEEMAEVYSSSRIVFNRSIADDVNMRVFEGLCSGSMLVTNDLSSNGQGELFRDGVHLVTYRNRDELLKKLEFYLQNEKQREQIASAGRTEVLVRHTYRHRMETILETVRSESARQVCQRPTDLGKGSRETRSVGIRSSVSNKSISNHASVRSAVASKSTTYFEFDRPDVLKLVPLTARRILDVGCGAGRLGAVIKSRQPAHVTGLELHPNAASRARNVIDTVYTGNIETEDFGWGKDTFDCVIFADVLEHLRNPEQVLGRVRSWLTPGGCLIASLPNVRHHSVIQSLLAGNWTYESAGLLDADHVRFFTRREIEKLMFRTGFHVEEIGTVGGEGYEAWIAEGRPQNVNVGGLQIHASSEQDAEEFFAYQFLIRAHVASIPDNGRTSIIIVTHNQLAYTRQCVDSIRLRTDEECELIFIDNGSTDGTVEYLRSIPGAIVVANQTNRGFPAAVNQGLQRATGNNILLLNNDTIVTTGWLRRLLTVLYSDPKIGMVGPVSNEVSGEQRIEVSYGNMAELDGFAWDWGRVHGHELLQTDRLVGFCLLIRREVIERIGGFDEQFGIGCFEDDDFCRRALAAGYQAVVVRGAFVHHFGSITFRSSDIDFAEVLSENQRRFDQKWRVVRDKEPEAIKPEKQAPAVVMSNLVLPTIRRPPRFLTAGTLEEGLRLVPNTMQLSACLIVRNNETTIRPCLESIRPWVDEIVVVDTGSTDATPKICEELGARLFRWAWRDDFAAARNESLRHARGAWIFWLDSDDTMPQDCGRRLRELAVGAHDERVLGYVMQVHCPGPDGDSPEGVTVVDHVKLVRNRPDLVFEFRIHEQILPAIRRAGGDVLFTDIYVVHSGSDHSPEGRQRKLERDFRLLHLEQQERPDHPFLLFNLGMTYADAQIYDKAIDALRRCLDRSESGESHVRKAYALLIGALASVGKHDEAWAACTAGLKLFPSDKELRFRSAMLHHHFGRHAEAERDYLSVLEPESDRHFTSVDTGIGGIKARHNLALVYEDAGLFEQAEFQWRKIVSEDPSYGLGWRGLGRVLLQSREPEHVEAEYRRMIESGAASRREGLMLRAQLKARQGAIAAARQDLETVTQEMPGSLDPLRLRCELLFKYGSAADAERSLQELVTRDPTDGAAHHNLGLVYVRQNQYATGVRCFQESLRLRPESAMTALELGRTFLAMRDGEQATVALTNTIRLDPTLDCSAEMASLDRLYERSVSDAEPRPLLSLCMIVRDNAKTLGACLSSIKEFVDEMIVVDTGSIDNSTEIARSYGASVYYFSWCDDFSAARNESLRYARGEWIIWIDSDDTIPLESAANLRNTVEATTDPTCLGQLIRVRCPRPTERGTDEAFVDQVRILRNMPGLKFTGRIHEQLLPAIQRLGGVVQHTGLEVVHSGADYSPETRKQKFDRNLRLLLLEEADHPDDFSVHLNLGMTFAEAGLHEKAIDSFRKSLDCAIAENQDPTKATSLLTVSLIELGKIDEAEKVCARGRQRDPDNLELIFHAGIIAQRTGRLADAAEHFERLLRHPPRTQLAGIDAGILGYKSHHNLAVVYFRQGKTALAETEWRHTIRKMPEYTDAWKGLGEALKAQGKFDDLKELCKAATTTQPIRCLALVWRSEIFGQLGDRDGQRRVLEQACREFPEILDVRQIFCKFLLDVGEGDKAEQLLQQLLDQDPTNLMVRHNLSTVYMATRRFEEAITTCQKTLEIDPNSVLTRMQFGFALNAVGRCDAAIEEWKRVLVLDPHNGPTRAALQHFAPPALRSEDQLGSQSLSS